MTDEAAAIAAQQQEIVLFCTACKCERKFSPRVVSVTVWMPHLVSGWHILEPDHELRICQSCTKAKFSLVDRCVRLHPATADQARPWTKAAILFADAQGLTVRQPGADRSVAQA